MSINKAQDETWSQDADQTNLLRDNADLSLFQQTERRPEQEVTDRHRAAQSETEQRFEALRSDFRSPAVRDALDILNAAISTQVDQRRSGAERALATLREAAAEIVARQTERSATLANAGAAELVRQADFNARQRQDLDQLAGRTLASLADSERQGRANAAAVEQDATRAVNQQDASRLIDGAAESAHRQADEEQRRMSAFVSDLRRQSDAITQRLTNDQISSLREQASIDSQLLPDDALQRIASEAGKQQGQQREWAARGQIAEELNAVRVGEEARLRNAGDPALQAFFIRGDQIRDADMRRCTDGVLVRENDRTGQLEVLKAYEVKAGQTGERSLNRQLEKTVGDFLAETRKYARDIVIEANVNAVGDEASHSASYRERQLSWEAANMDYAAAEVERTVSDLMSAKVRGESGQLDRTLERLRENTEGATRVYIDGVARELVFARQADAARSARIEGAVPKDVEHDSRTVELNITTDQLRRMADAVRVWLDAHQQRRNRAEGRA